MENMMIFGISRFSADIKVAMVKPGLTWNIREYTMVPNLSVSSSITTT